MKIFKMNDFDWVCAENEEQAKEFYEKESGFTREEIEDEFVGEVPLTETMMIPFDELPPEEKATTTSADFKKFYGEIYVKRSFDWVIKNWELKEPCIIASTEM